MTKTQYTITDTEEFSGATVFIDGEPHTVSSTNNPSWTAIVEILLSGEDPENRLLDLIYPAKDIESRFKSLSERITVRGGTLYLDGDAIENEFTDHILRILGEGTEEKDAGFPAYVAFLEKLATNPSKKSRKHLASFVEANGMVLDPDGDIIAYKGVSSSGHSTFAGYGIVDGVIFEHAKLQNNVGSVVEIPRSMVDNDRSVACSVGLHVGAYAYASTFGSKLLTVKVNPRDVVSVPSDHYDQKVRVSRYVVVENNKGEIHTPTHSFVADSFVEPEDEDYSEDENETEEPDFYDENDDESDEAEWEEYRRGALAEQIEAEAAPTLIQVVPVVSLEEQDFLDRVARMAIVLESLPEGTNLKRYRNKNVTQKNRLAFDKAIELA